MSTGIHIYLPGTTNVEEVTNVIQWVGHNPVRIEHLLQVNAKTPRSNQSNTVIDPTRAAGPNNPWVVRFEQLVELDFSHHTGLAIMGVLRFELSGVECQGYYYPEPRGIEGRKLDLFTSDPITRTLGKKLIDFFGGKVTTSELGLMETKEKVLLTNNSPFLDIDPSMAQLLSPDNMRFYCFYSWLANFTKLTTEDLRRQGYDGATKQNNWEHVNDLYQTLKVAESKFTLENLLPKITEGPTEEMVAEKRL